MVGRQRVRYNHDGNQWEHTLSHWTDEISSNVSFHSRNFCRVIAKLFCNKLFYDFIVIVPEDWWWMTVGSFTQRQNSYWTLRVPSLCQEAAVHRATETVSSNLQLGSLNKADFIEEPNCRLEETHTPPGQFITVAHTSINIQNTFITYF